MDEAMIDFISTPHDSLALERSEQEIQYLARSKGDTSLFEPDIPRDKWGEFCVAAEKAEIERRTYVPAGKSTVTVEERELLKRGDVLRDEQAEALLEKRDGLVEKARPQCVDPEGEKEAAEIERLVNEEFGIEDWSAIDVSIGGP